MRAQPTWLHLSSFASAGKAWTSTALLVWRKAAQDNIGLISAGVAFYSFLALVPMMGAVVLCYGLIAEQQTVIENIEKLASILPADAANLVGAQLMDVVKTSAGKKGLGLALALGFALFGARNGAGALISALNITNRQIEVRSFARLSLLAFTMTGFAVVAAVAAMSTIVALGRMESLFAGASSLAAVVSKILSYALLTGAGAAGAATLYRFGPAHENVSWRWLTLGSAFSAVSWLLLTLGFETYVANFGHYNVIYGSLGAVAVLLIWLYLSSYILLLGAELNSYANEGQQLKQISATCAQPSTRLVRD